MTTKEAQIVRKVKAIQSYLKPKESGSTIVKRQMVDVFIDEDTGAKFLVFEDDEIGTTCRSSTKNWKDPVTNEIMESKDFLIVPMPGGKRETRSEVKKRADARKAKQRRVLKRQAGWYRDSVR